jgi:FkbM family methyltransferase
MKLVKNTWLPDNDTHFECVIAADGSYQKKTLLAAMEYVAKPKVFFDVGAHVGLWSRTAINLGFRRIYAFEPNQETFECLVKNVISNKAYLYNFGLWEADSSQGAKSILVNEITNSGAVRVVELKEGLQSVEVRDINDFPVDELSASLDLNEHEVLVKIDTEGAEKHCVLAMQKILTTLHPVVIIEQHTSKEALGLLLDMGMVIKKIKNKDAILTWN